MIDISKIPGGEYEVVGGCGDLFWGKGNFYGIGKIGGCFNLVDHCFEQLIHVVRGGHAGGVLL